MRNFRVLINAITRGELAGAAIALILLAITVFYVNTKIFFSEERRREKTEQIISQTLIGIASAEISWRGKHSSYTSLQGLVRVSQPYIRPALINGEVKGYKIEVASGKNKFYLTAWNPKNIGHSFYIDEDGILCKSEDLTDTPRNAHYNPVECPPRYVEE